MLLMNGVYFVGLFSVFCDGYKILIVYPLPQKSHKILGDGYVDTLLEAGHEVTLITPYPRKYSGPNLTQIDVSQTIKFHIGQSVNIGNLMQDIGRRSKYIAYKTMYNVARSTVESEGVQRLLKDSKQRFDLIVAVWLFSDFYAGFSAVFNCPYIWAVSMNPSWLVLQLIENRSRNPEYYPDMQSPNSPPFSLATRLQEYAHQMNVMGMKRFTFNGLERQLYEDNIVPILRSRGRNVPNYDDLVLNASLLIVNSHAALTQTMTLPLNCVTVGGYHIGSRIPSLPKDLQELMDKATDGVIYFSMGTNINSETFPKSVIQGLLDVFKELKQLVLWKFHYVSFDLPNNVHILQWAPQQSILRHPNCVLFITHGGYLSMTEAVHFGVPLVTIPVFADQFANAAKLQLRGIGMKVDLTYNLAEDLKAAIGEVIGNQRYKENMEQSSLIYHDQKSPRRRLVDWVEYVVRTQGAAHLRSPASLVSWYQQVYLDLLLLIMVVTIVVVWIMIMLVGCLIKKIN